MVMNIIGRLTRDAEIRTLDNEKKVVNFSIAVNDSYRTKEGERIEQTTYFDCSFWRSTNVAKVLTKGTVAELTGRISTRAWLGKDGEPKAALNFNASQIKLHGGGKKPATITATADVQAPVTDDLPF